MASFPWTGFSYSPPLLVGVVQVALAQTHSLLVSRVLLRGKPGQMPGLEGCTGPAMLSRSQITGARTRAICCPFHLHSHLMLCQQLSFFTPGTRLILPSPTWATRALGLSWPDITVTQKQRDILPWNTFQSGIIYHKPSSKLHPLLTVMSRFASPLLLSVWVISINRTTIKHSAVRPQLLKYTNGSWPEQQKHLCLSNFHQLNNH